jgi:hypothetical protein
MSPSWSNDIRLFNAAAMRDRRRAHPVAFSCYQAAGAPFFFD